MNIAEYIKSGVIESCILGLATKAECTELEVLCARHPEIAAAKLEFELALEREAMKNAIAPPADLKRQILKEIADFNPEPKLYAIPPKPSLMQKLWPLAAAAFLIIAIASGFWAWRVNRKYNGLLAKNIEVSNQVNHGSHTGAILALKTIVERPTIKWSTLVEPANSGHCMAHIYWDTLSKNTFLLLGNIPPSLADQEFQLWTNVDNKFVNVGFFRAEKEGLLVQMKNIDTAGKFYITIGKPSEEPTPDIIYAVGEL